MSGDPNDASSAEVSAPESVEQAVSALADLLHETSDHHGQFEATAPKHDWWDWYAPYMYARQHGRSSDEASHDAGQRMARILGTST